MIVVVATTEEGLPGEQARLHDLGLDTAAMVAPSETRRLLLATVDDDAEGARVVAHLRAEGGLAVLRPEGGARLGAWTRHTRPIAIGDRLNLCFAWSEHDRRGLANVVELDPGWGFGTGDHPSTRLLLEELAGRIAGGERVLDVGCGSGVLGLGALQLGATRLVAVDIDEHAIEATRRNAALNGFEGRVEAGRVPLAELDGTFDVVVANIGRAALVELGADLVRRVSPAGWLAVSGMAPSQCGLVAASLRPLRVQSSRRSAEWAALVLAP